MSIFRPPAAALLALVCFFGAWPPLLAGEERVLEARHGMVVCVSRPASEIGCAVLRQGGNAVDAAVAVALALAVTYPEAGNIGGGGFMLIYPADDRKPICVDYRETAPAAAQEKTFVNETNRLGALTVGVPGTVRGLALAQARYGKLAWKDLVEPAVRVATDGFALDRTVATTLEQTLHESAGFAEFRRVFTRPGGGVWQPGDRLQQPDLARTLTAIAADPEIFYRGAVAEQIAAEMQRSGGLLTRADLAGYEPRLRAPIHGTFRGYDIFGAPPPSSGGVVLVEILNILETFDLKGSGRWSPKTNHTMIEAMRRAYRDRAAYLGDSDFVPLPAHLTSKEYARKLAASIDPDHATPSADLAGEITLADETPSTTHFSVIDGDGMAVANTYTLEQPFGARIVVRGAGFLLNNQMGDFNWRPGVTDRKGTIGTSANRIAPGKRMLSSQAPTIVARDRQVRLVCGSPGGRTIINTVLCTLINVLEFEMEPGEAVDAPRLHQGWFPDQVQFEGLREPRFADLTAVLRRLGHPLVVPPEPQGDAHTILVRDGVYYGAADHRLSGWASGY